MFWKERLWERYFTGEFDIDFRKRRDKDMTDHTGKHIRWSQELRFVDALTREEICRCHWYLSDDDTVCGSGAPDPKEINIKGVNVHIHSDGGTCELCEEGDRLPAAVND
jgi:hypothetical protein